jgi:hypothetical protein
MLTSSIDESDRERAKEFPYVAGFLSKPLNNAMLQSICDKYQN